MVYLKGMRERHAHVYFYRAEGEKERLINPLINDQ